jgi:hypothetical protein
MVWCAATTGCATGLRKFFFVKIIIACSIVTLWLLLSAFYVFLILRERADKAQLELITSKELESRVACYCQPGRNEARPADVRREAGNVPLGMAPIGTHPCQSLGGRSAS